MGYLQNFEKFSFNTRDNTFQLNNYPPVDCMFLSVENTCELTVSAELWPFNIEKKCIQLPIGFNYFPREKILCSPINTSGLICLPSLSSIEIIGDVATIDISMVNVTTKKQLLSCTVHLEEVHAHKLIAINYANKNILLSYQTGVII